MDAQTRHRRPLVDAGTDRILDDDGNDVPRASPARLYFKAPDVGRFEYFKAPEKTSQSYRGDWFTLGDMGYLDEDGYLFLNGRNAETIISGGVNIYPQEIDSELLKHPAVVDVCTVGVPNEEWGEEVKSVVQLEDGPQRQSGTRRRTDRVRALASTGIQDAAVDRFRQRPAAAAERQDPASARPRRPIARPPRLTGIVSFFIRSVASVSSFLRRSSSSG